jgi:hypothetical protein
VPDKAWIPAARAVDGDRCPGTKGTVCPIPRSSPCGNQSLDNPIFRPRRHPSRKAPRGRCRRPTQSSGRWPVGKQPRDRVVRSDAYETANTAAAEPAPLERCDRTSAHRRAEYEAGCRPLGDRQVLTSRRGSGGASGASSTSRALSQTTPSRLSRSRATYRPKRGRSAILVVSACNRWTSRSYSARRLPTTDAKDSN